MMVDVDKFTRKDEAPSDPYIHSIYDRAVSCIRAFSGKSSFITGILRSSGQTNTKS